MITLSGVLVTPQNDTAPSLVDMAVQLGRQPRFAGATTRYWPVLLHSLVCERIMWETGNTPKARLHALIHDGHESITCDVPTTWKTEAVRMQQLDLDLRIFRSIGIQIPDDEIDSLVAKVDHLAVIAEGAMYGPPGIVSWFKEQPMGLALDVVNEIGSRYSTPAHCDGPRGVAVRDFIELAHSLIQTVREERGSRLRKPESEDRSGRRSAGQERGKDR